MDVELLNALGIDSKKDLKELIEALEDKQGEFFERLETVSDEARRDELSELLSQIDAQIAQLKAQLKAMSSGIVIDAGAASATSEEAAKKEAEKREAEKKEAEKAKKAAEAQKIQELKKREAERRKQADQAAAAAASAQNAASQQGASKQQSGASKASANKQQVSSSKQPSANNTPQQPATSAPQGPADLKQGLVLYNKKSFTGAFAIFKPLAEKGDVTAEYMLGSMYHRGEGTPQDEDRAKFWMEKAAKAGDVNAQYDYAIMLLSDVHNQDLIMGMHYLGLAADQDHKESLIKFVELSQGSDELYILQDAVQYCKKLIATTEDSFDKQKYTTTLSNLTAKLKVAKKQESIANRASKLTIIGAIISIISIVSIFLGVHQQYFIAETFLGSFPRGLQEFLFGGWMDITKSGGSASAAGMVLLGWMFRTAGNHPGRNAKASAMEAVCVAFRYIAIAGHILISILAGTKLFGNFFASAISIAIFLLLGKFIGWLLGKTLKTR